MSRMIGTVSRGVRAPIIKSGDNIVDIVTDCVLEAAKSEGFELRDRDVVAMTEAVNSGLESSFKLYSITWLCSSSLPVLPVLITKPPWGIPLWSRFSSSAEIKCTVVS